MVAAVARRCEEAESHWMCSESQFHGVCVAVSLQEKRRLRTPRGGEVLAQESPVTFREKPA
ncbi:hypothetical protein CB1_000930001, partial [Camelus ferus]